MVFRVQLEGFSCGFVGCRAECGDGILDISISLLGEVVFLDLDRGASFLDGRVDFIVDPFTEYNTVRTSKTIIIFSLQLDILM